jgi:hypothetical protein
MAKIDETRLQSVCFVSELLLMMCSVSSDPLVVFNASAPILTRDYSFVMEV